MSIQSLKRLVGLWIVVALLLAACGDSGAGTFGGSSALDPSPQLTLEEADQVAETFFKAWTESDFGAMYGLISPNSQDATTLEAFSTEYETVQQRMTVNGLNTTITSSLRQGTTAAILYDVTFTTNRFGDIVDAGRTMRLIETPQGWRVAWSRMDIFADLAEGARLDLISTQPGRGNIYDRNGQVLADQNGRAVELYLVKQDINNFNACLALLSRLLRRELDDLERVTSPFNADTRFFAAEIDPDTFQQEEQNLLETCDIGDQPDDTRIRNTRRYYGEIAPHIVGYVSQIRPEQVDQYTAQGYPQDALVGQEGIEQSYEEYLAGKVGGRLVITSPTGETIREIARVGAEPGQSVYLTIDRDLQAAVLDAFREAYNFATPTWAQTSPGGAAVVMNVKTGEVLAAVSYPGFDPGIFSPDSPVWNRADVIAALSSDPRTPLLNRVTQAQLPLGSAFKIISIATGLDSGYYDPGRTTYCTGTWNGEQYGDRVRTDWKLDGHGAGINAHWGLTYSCNPYFWDMGVALYNNDPEVLTNYAYKMGLGVATGQDDIAEEPGQVPNPDLYYRLNGTPWNISAMLNFVIGQGELQVNPLQVVRMVAAIANGGQMLKPQFVSKVQLIGEEPVLVNQPVVMSDLGFAPETYEIIREAMCDVTLSPNGTARYIFSEWYEWQQNPVTICGKTGTAQTGGAGTKPQAWFVAFAPQNDPEIAVVVVVENSCEGSEVSAPLVRRIIEDYYGMPHSAWPPLWESGCLDLGE